jgi:hypothetical protein
MLTALQKAKTDIENSARWEGWRYGEEDSID